MLKIRQLDNNHNIEGKRILLRTDFNVPMNDGSITETSRIQKVLPTIKSLINKKTKIIIIAHLGRPKGKFVPELTLQPIAKKLSKYLNQNVVFLNKNIGKNVIEKSIMVGIPATKIGDATKGFQPYAVTDKDKD